jgi:hypothetical protein
LAKAEDPRLSFMRWQRRGWSAFADHDEGYRLDDAKTEETELKTEKKRNPKAVDDENPL